MRLGSLLALAGVMCWSLAFAFNGAALDAGLASQTIIGIRMLIAAVGFLILFATGAIPFKAIPTSQWLRIALATASGLLVYHIALLHGQQYIASAPAAAIVMTSPIFATIFGAIGSGDRVTLIRLLGLAAATIGSILVLGGDGWTVSGAPWHAIPVLVCAPILLALFTLIAKPLMVHGSANVTAQMIIIAAVVLAPALLLDVETRHSLLALSPQGWLAIAGLGLLSTLLGYTLWFEGVRLLTDHGVTAAQVTAYQYTIPIFAAAFAWFLIGESIGIGFVVGTALSIGGAAMVLRPTGNKSVRARTAR